MIRGGVRMPAHMFTRRIAVMTALARTISGGDVA
jgi:hypothetical protein